MNIIEANALITWINQADRRITNTDPTVEIWASVLVDVPLEPAKAAVLEHYRLNGDKQPDPKGVRSLAYDLRDRATAKLSALEAAPPARHPNTWRERNPERWDQLFNQGQAQGNAERAQHTNARNAS